MTDRSQVQQAIDAGGGVLRLEPCWVPRSFMIPGRRLRLHPDDYYACGGHRGGINERWFSSTTAAKAGVRIENRSETEPLVMLKHFGPGNPDAESFRKR